ncbi:MAG: sigma-70 family RNA polymerase sigma factor [Planctomycetes bacterium]|nr:sigma-70 family RNA polymerase sigma factor [Planctomycetota bacterium]
MAPPVDTALEELVARAAWIRKLARALVRDPDAADELVQEAWVAALERPPEPGMPIRRWLAAVMRNFARDRWRESERRAATERAAARPERSGDAALDQLDAHALLVEAVRALDEPYRTTVVLRFLEELSPAEVAARTGVPLRTVHTRTTRALAKLRERLDRRAGDRATWLACLAPLLQHPGTPYLGALLVNSKLFVAAAALAVVSATGWWLARGPEAALVERASDVRSSSERPAALDASAPSLERAEVATTTPTPAPAPATLAAAAPLATATRVRGLVIGADDQPLAGVEVELQPDSETAVANTDAPPPRAKTDTRGAFEFAEPPKSGRVRIATVGFTTVFEPRYVPGAPERELVVVAAPSLDFSGTVVDEHGAPIARATVALQGALELRSRLSRVIDGSRALTWTATTDDHGRFALPETPSLPQGKLFASCAGYVMASLAEPQRSDSTLSFTLAKGSFVLAGQVVFPDGKPCPGAWVSLGEDDATTDADGRFRIEPTDAVREGHEELKLALRAVKQGWLPVRLVAAADSIDAPHAWPEPLVLTLEREALAIRGRVLDADGKLVPKARLRLLDGEYAGMRRHEIDGIRFSTESTYEQLIRGGDWDEAVTATELGAFEFTGLQQRAYVLRAIDPRTLAVLTSAPIAAGTDDVELRFAPEPRRIRIAGRVESLHGRPVPHEQVTLVRIVGDGTSAADFVHSEATFSDDDGRFEFLDVSTHASLLTAGPTRLDLAPELDLEALKVVVPQSTHARIELGPDAPNADGFRFVDAEGKSISVVVDHGGLSFSSERWLLSDGRSETMSVLESATTLILTRGSEELQRIPVRLALDELNVIRL